MLGEIIFKMYIAVLRSTLCRRPAICENTGTNELFLKNKKNNINNFINLMNSRVFCKKTKLIVW